MAPKQRSVVRLPNLYIARPVHLPAARPQSLRVNGSTVALIHGSANGKADWLAEIFEWLSCADEYSVVERDSVGRVPFAYTLAGRNSLDPLVPRAAVAMQMLQDQVRRVTGDADGANTPVNGLSHFIVNTHDVDFLPTTRRETVFRLAKNCVISLLTRLPSLAGAHAMSAVRTACGAPIPFLSPDALAKLEACHGASASYYFLVENSHRRDGNYNIRNDNTLTLLRELQSMGMEVGVHGSYKSLDEAYGLAVQYQTLAELGFKAHGGRQHWLRLTVERLIDSVQRAHALYDTSLGWTDRVGFRAGASFAFPPYDFSKERAATFLELPLVIADSALAAMGDITRAREIAEQVLERSRRGCGGVSVLWHPACFGGVQLPAWVGESFWSLMKCSKEKGDSWISAERFLEMTRERYVAAGLLSDVDSGATGPDDVADQEVDSVGHNATR